MKYLVEIETDRVRFTRLKKKQLQLVSTRAGRLYDVSDRVNIKDHNRQTALIIYPINGQQPMTPSGTVINPDDTRALIDHCTIAGTERDIWQSLGKISIEKLLTIVIVGGALAWYGLSLMGL